MAQLVASGATFTRTHAAQVKHMNEMFERAILHPGFAVVETLSECTMFNPGSFDDGNPRKGGVFDLVDEETQDLESIAAAMDLSQNLSPGKFGVYYETKRPTKNELEREDQRRPKQGRRSFAADSPPEICCDAVAKKLTAISSSLSF